jgi:hypothetical protein
MRSLPAVIAPLYLTRLLLGLFESIEERVNGLELDGKNCPTLGSVSKALF